MNNLNKKIIIGIVASIIVLVSIYYVYIQNESDEFNDFSNTLDNNIVEDSINKENLIIVHITGAIEKPGIIYLKEGKRIADAIEKAGGSLEIADLNKINLAYKLEDGQKIYIPSIGEEDTNLEYITEKSGDNVIVENNKDGEENEKININNANQTELELLPGIGPSTALKIIMYREENGKFESIEDLKNVSGIGDSKYNNIKDKICI